MNHENEFAVLQIFHSEKTDISTLVENFDLSVRSATETCTEITVRETFRKNPKLQTLTLLSASVVVNTLNSEIKMILTMNDEEEMHPGMRPLTLSPGCEDFVFQGTLDVPIEELNKLKAIIARTSYSMHLIDSAG